MVMNEVPWETKMDQWRNLVRDCLDKAIRASGLPDPLKKAVAYASTEPLASRWRAILVLQVGEVLGNDRRACLSAATAVEALRSGVSSPPSLNGRHFAPANRSEGGRMNDHSGVFMLLPTVTRLAFLLLSFLATAALPAAVVIPTAPPDAPPSPLYLVKVNRKPVFTYDARTSEPRNCSYALFDLATGDLAKVVVEVPAGFSSVRCVPAKAGVKLTSAGHFITLEMRRPEKIALLLNGGVDNPLFILANPPEIQAPRPDAPGIHYFGPGRHDMGEQGLKSGETLYLAGGAVVTGTIRAQNSDNITIRGRGIIDAHGGSGMLIFMQNCRHVRIEGITMVDQPSMNWTMCYKDCNDLLIENIKEMNGDRWSNDGCNFVDCQHAVIRDSFIKTDDDCVCIKARPAKFNGAGADVRDIRIESCFLWNTWAHAVQIGPETNARSISQVLVRNLDVISTAPPNDISYWGTLGIYISDQAVISNVTLRDIRVEFPAGNPKLFDFQIAPTQWGTSPYRGRIRDVLIDKVRVSDLSAGRWIGVFHGAGSGNLIENVTFRDLRLGGRLVTGVLPESMDVNPYVRRLRFLAAQ